MDKKTNWIVGIISVIVIVVVSIYQLKSLAAPCSWTLWKGEPGKSSSKNYDNSKSAIDAYNREGGILTVSDPRCK